MLYLTWTFTVVRSFHEDMNPEEEGRNTYIPAFSEGDFQDWYRKVTNETSSASSELITHMKRELMQAILLLLLDPRFLYAYVHGLEVLCADGILRLLFPRFFTYSADYPEKIILATIRFLGGCPCPRCMIKKNMICGLGTAADQEARNNARTDSIARQGLVEQARKLVFRSGKSVASGPVEKILKPHSMTLTRNAFSIRLFEHGFDYHRMFVPDLLHEFELGTWKAVFTHLMRILHAAGDGAIQTLNKRYRSVPTFGRNTIRRFSENASAMKKLAARDFEDLLQCAMPVFEGLLPEPHNGIVMDLLFTLAMWHALAKLRLQTETTLHLLQSMTVQLGSALRTFNEITCAHYYTADLPGNDGGKGPKTARTTTQGDGGKGKGPSKASRSFNMSTYKLHALGDYFQAIMMFGTTEGYSTQIGELEHRRVKRFYVRTNKRSTFAWQIAKHERRERLLYKIEQNGSDGSDEKAGGRNLYIPFEESEALPSTSPTVHYYMPHGRKFKINVTNWLHQNRGDPAIENFLPLLKTHLLERLEGHAPGTRDYTASEQNRLTFLGNFIYQHKYFRINFTTYDMQRDQDSINPRTHPDIMVLAGNSSPDSLESDELDDHPYLYARVLGIYHADIHWRASDPEKQSSNIETMDFLWVRWFAHDPKYSRRLGDRRLPRLEFALDRGFGFVNPDLVIRGCHLIPAYAYGQVSWLGKSIVHRPVDNGLDWKYHCVNLIVDRDAVMRYIGGAVGHGTIGQPQDTSIEDAIESDNNTLATDDEDAPADEREKLDYGYRQPLVRNDAALDEDTETEGEDDMGEDGEDLLDFDQAENDGYGTFN
ncbi:hypothetical protein NP233_g670 [Leucocoprinus birnbaumii]|uniref:Uncharacterized protein n=1 Tax=Leucocoprinus birnbaumii TaxID=56174 RepID=A0AAD5W589_9AGAR|nr:hypothetical protein NP233_g670 [Leucocoprinus birnbaumii]